MELSFPSELGYEVVARDAVAMYARCIGLTTERIDDLKTAVSEACINAIEHGNQLKMGLRVHISCQDDGDRLLIDVRDQGQKEVTTENKPMSIEEKIAGLGPLRGMGLMLMASLSDEAGFIPVPQGNCYRLTFYYQHHSSPVAADADA
jgi:serine/threonine-protein kinase RsbW